MLANGVIDETQHLYGMQIVTLWTIASRPFIKAIQYEQRSHTRLPDFAMINLSRMGAEDQFYKTMSLLRHREHELICRICLHEQGAIEAGRALKLQQHHFLCARGVRCAGRSAGADARSQACAGKSGGGGDVALRASANHYRWEA